MAKVTTAGIWASIAFCRNRFLATTFAFVRGRKANMMGTILVLRITRIVITLVLINAHRAGILMDETKEGWAC
jgi:hypothetical protein